MGNWKKVTAGVLCACLTVSCVPGVNEIGGLVNTKICAQAATSALVVTGACGEKATWEYNRDTKVLTIAGTGKIQVYKYNATWENYDEEVKKIVIGDEITEIAEYTFASFTALEQIEFGNGVKKIGHHALDGCTSLKSVVLGGNIEELGVCSFANCENLSEVSIGKNLKVVYWDVFKGCNALQNIKLDEENKNILIDGNVLKNAKISGDCGEMALAGTFGNNVKYTYDHSTRTLTFSGTGNMYSGHEDDEVGVDQEEEYYWNFFSKDPNKMVIKEEMEKVVIGDAITNIGGFAFADCKALKEVKLGKCVKKIEDGAFVRCTSLKKINWTDQIETIEPWAFMDCNNLTKLYVGKSLKKIYDAAFSGCNQFKQVKVHKANTHFSKRDNMLLDKKQTKLILGCYASDTTCHIYGSVKKWNEDVVENEKIEKFEVSSKNKSYASKNGLLYSKDEKTLHLCPKGKKGTATVSDKATKIDDDAFLDCNGLKTIIIGKNVKTMNGYCSKRCNNLKTMKIRKGNKNYVFENGALLSKNKKKLISCILLKTDTYTVPKGVTTIAKDAFNRCNKLKHLVLSDAITDYELDCLKDHYWHYDQPKIESITLGKKYYNSGKVQFLSDARYLKAIYVSEENPYYSSVDGILYNKEQTKLLVCPVNAEICKMPNTVTGVDEKVKFSYVKELYVSDGITDMTNLLDVFCECKVLHIGKKVEKLKRVRRVEALEQIMVDSENQNYRSEDGMLYSKDGSRLVWCPEHKKGKVTISTGTAIIGTDAFYGCNQVTDIVIPDTVKTIEKQAFGDTEKDYGMNFGAVLELTMHAVVFWVPAGKLEFYKALFTKEAGFRENMVIKEMES